MLFGIIAMILVGLSWIILGVVMGRAPKLKLSVSTLMLVGSLGVFIGYFIYALFTHGFDSPASALGMVALICTIEGIANYLQLEFMSRAMQHGPNGVIWSVVQSAFIFPVLMSILFFGETKSVLNYIGLLSILGSLFMFGCLKDNSASGPWRMLMLFSFISTGVTQCSSIFLSYYPSLAAVSSSFKVAVFFLVMGLCGLLLKAKQSRSLMKELLADVKVRGFWTHCVAMYLPFGTVNAILLYPGMNSLERANAGVLAFPLMICSCIIGFQVVAILFLKEKCTPLQWVALALCLSGIIAFCIPAS